MCILPLAESRHDGIRNLVEPHRLVLRLKVDLVVMSRAHNGVASDLRALQTDLSAVVLADPASNESTVPSTRAPWSRRAASISSSTPACSWSTTIVGLPFMGENDGHARAHSPDAIALAEAVGHAS